MNWQENTLGECGKLASKDVKFKDFPRGLRFRLKLMNFIQDWLSWEYAFKTGWRMPRNKFHNWRLCRKLGLNKLMK